MHVTWCMSLNYCYLIVVFYVNIHYYKTQYFMHQYVNTNMTFYKWVYEWDSNNSWCYMLPYCLHISHTGYTSCVHTKHTIHTKKVVWQMCRWSEVETWYLHKAVLSHCRRAKTGCEICWHVVWGCYVPAYITFLSWYVHRLYICTYNFHDNYKSYLWFCLLIQSICVRHLNF